MAAFGNLHPATTPWIAGHREYRFDRGRGRPHRTQLPNDSDRRHKGATERHVGARGTGA